MTEDRRESSYQSETEMSFPANNGNEEADESTVQYEQSLQNDPSSRNMKQPVGGSKFNLKLDL